MNETYSSRDVADSFDATKNRRRVRPQPKPRIADRYRRTGCDNGRSKLTPADVIAIREMCAGGVSRRFLALHVYGVSIPAIRAVVTRRSWKHVD